MMVEFVRIKINIEYLQMEILNFNFGMNGTRQYYYNDLSGLRIIFNLTGLLKLVGGWDHCTQGLVSRYLGF